ncbi:autotransporter outer membrane beta-barrel domain-containing protein [Ruegeria sp.]|uniref:autotransporter outer membrane beta-barrel domain-containing protein n=1 Tax=Ruegeria sp. TaxID=1879320 RepID=UPI002317DDFD|nr:autotransporter outer membrane beta-barrel domain-containing protein [Ruegeria sp.]MDA7965594.1 autotransporter outer membrane beta-barrel domain-containing protein [Ruegeria sp.]
MSKGIGARTQPGAARGGRVLKWKGRVASVAPSVFLASVSVAALSVGIATAEVISTQETTQVDFNLDEDNTITSTGSVDLTTGSTAVLIDTDYTSVFTNDGTIMGPAPSETSGFGVVLNGILSATGQIVNNGTVNIDVNSTSLGAALGYLMLFDYAGAFVNTGTVRATVNVTSSGSASALGALFVNGTEAGASISNSGTITAMANGAGTSDVAAFGLLFADDAEGSITNDGTITANAADGTTVIAVGIDIQGTLGAKLTNSGTISTVATEDGNDAISIGVRVQDMVAGDVTNMGTISAMAAGSDSANAAGFQFQNGLDGNFENSGTLTATADADTSAARAGGLFVIGTVNGDVTNSGTVNARADGDNGATAVGYAIAGDMTGNFENSGTIDITATRALAAGGPGPFGSVPEASGFLVSGSATGDVTNTGTITASADAASGTASVAGVYVGDLQGQFSNTGVVTATGTGSADAFGLNFQNFDGVITDVGQVTATSENGNAYAIFLGTGTGTLNVDSMDQVTGLIRVQDHNVNLDAQGGSAVFNFEDAASGSGTFTTTVSDGQSAWFVQDAGGAAPIYAVVDGGDLAPLGDITAFYGDVVGRVSDALRFDRPEEVSRGLSVGGFRPFAMIDGEARQFESDSGIDTDVTLFNGSAGYSGQLDNGLAVALGMGVFRADGDSDTTDFDTTGFYLDAAIGRQFGAYTVEAGLGYGWLSTDRSRQISGNPDANADYDSTLLTVHLGVERAFDVRNDIGLLGFGEVRYTRQQDDAYTETGSVANATVGEITTEVIEARLGVEVEKAFNNGGVLFGQLSGVLRRDQGDDAANVTVFTTSQSLAFASTDFNGASLVVGYEKELLSDMTLELTAEQEFGDAAQGPNIRAGLRWAF